MKLINGARKMLTQSKWQIWKSVGHQWDSSVKATTKDKKTLFSWGLSRMRRILRRNYSQVRVKMQNTLENPRLSMQMCGGEKEKRGEWGKETIRM